MKKVSDRLIRYLNTEKNFISCDLYELSLFDGRKYLYADTDRDITYNGKIYKSRGIIIKRKQVKLHSTVVVDTLSVSVKAGMDDKIGGTSIKAAGHKGILDGAKLKLMRCFFKDERVLGTISLFTGTVEVKRCGGLGLDLTVKAKTQGLSSEFPTRRYYPQGSYYSSDGTVIDEDEADEGTVIAPFVPLKEVLL